MPQTHEERSIILLHVPDFSLTLSSGAAAAPGGRAAHDDDDDGIHCEAASSCS